MQRHVSLAWKYHLKMLFKISWERREQHGRGEVDMEYISLHIYITSTPSDIEVHAEHQLRVDRSTWSVEKNT